MIALTARFPDDISIQKGDHVTLEAVLTRGGLMVTRLVKRDALPDRKQAVARFLQRWSGAGQLMGEEEVRDGSRQDWDEGRLRIRRAGVGR